ncbi:hypothetical protein HMPREF0972_02505 [Actinomyces sp. oral taxon 848 str. F0332]|nr:hypothetical protein HMPREF0972_02505 [Actinomyces sp. oral taxon 848 str. F0332]
MPIWGEEARPFGSEGRPSASESHPSSLENCPQSAGLGKVEGSVAVVGGNRPHSAGLGLPAPKSTTSRARISRGQAGLECPNLGTGKQLREKTARSGSP